MAVNDPVWSYGQSKLFNSSGTTTDPDDAWSYGQNALEHEYVEGGATYTAAGSLSSAGALSRMIHVARTYAGEL